MKKIPIRLTIDEAMEVFSKHALKPFSENGDTPANVGFLGCVNENIAKHFSKYFGMLIIKAKYSNLNDFEIIEDKYGNA